jgi:hypothetical protein
MDVVWDQELAGLLTELSATQDAVLELLDRKRSLLAQTDTAGLKALHPQETRIVARLQGCLDRRRQLLGLAGEQGLPKESLRSLAAALPARERGELAPRLAECSHRARLLKHQSLTQWVVAQRTLLHLSQLLEIIATRGRPNPTYEKGRPSGGAGTFVDEAA